MSSTFNFKNPEATNLLGALFDKSGLLLTFINKGGTKQMVDIFERISLNNATNEPIFVGLALAGGLAAAPPPAILVKIFLYSRIGHNLAFAFMPVTKSAVPRTTCYVTGAGVTGLVAAIVYISCAKSSKAVVRRQNIASVAPRGKLSHELLRARSTQSSSSKTRSTRHVSLSVSHRLWARIRVLMGSPRCAGISRSSP